MSKSINSATVAGKTVPVLRKGMTGAQVTAAFATADKITGTRTAKPADKRGPKQGSARANQSAPINPDLILSVASARTNNGTVITSNGGETLVRTAGGQGKEFTALARTGQSFKALATYCKANPVVKPTAKLANGVDGRAAPHCAKAVSDARAKPTPAAAKATGKGKDRVVKAPKDKQPSKGTDRAYAKGSKKDESKPDTFRKYMLSTILAHKSSAAAKAAHAASGQYPTHKLDFNWSAQQGYIVLK